MPEEILKVGHWFNSGDFLTVMPGLRHFYHTEGKKSRIYQKLNLPAFYYEGAEHPVRTSGDVNTSMNKEMFDMMKPLVESQSYIESWNEWCGETVDFDYIRTRDSRLIPLPNSDIHFWSFYVFPQLSCDLSEKWLEVPRSLNVFNDLVIADNVIVNRTQRYTNPYINYYFLKEFQNNVIFAGTEKEHKIFCEDFKLEIPRLIVKDFLELAQAIDSCRFFVGNQSLNFHIANSLKKKRILEVCGSFPNTLPHGKDGWAFLHQPSLELYFKRLFNNEKI